MNRKAKFFSAVVLVLTASLALGGTIGYAGEKLIAISQPYAEPQILCEAIKILIEKHTDLTVEHIPNFQGSTVMHQAMIHGDADMYISYTGTQFTGVLGMKVTPEWKNREKVLRYVQENFDKKFNVKWYDPFGFNNTFAIAVRRETAEKYNLKKISDLVPYASKWTIAVDQTFKERVGDGYYDFARAYGLKFRRVASMDYGLMYRALASGSVDVAVAYSTDGRIDALDLVVLEDDKHFFPPYDASLVIRKEVVEKYPIIDEIVKPLIGTISDADMQRVNRWVDVDGMSPREAARRFLKERGLL